MIAFVTGATGFVGTHLCQRLRREGWQVRALVRSPSKAAELKAAGCDLARGSLHSPRALREAITGCDKIFHLAAITKALSAREFRSVNGVGTLRVLDAAHEARFRGQFLLLSSLAAAGPALDERPRGPADPIQPVSNYGRGKRLGEFLALTETRRHEFDLTILRPGAIYGPREHQIHQVLKPLDKSGIAIMAGPDTEVQLTHVEDVVDALYRSAVVEGAIGKAFFVNDPQRWCLSELYDLLGQALGRPVRVVRVPLWAARLAAGTIDLASAAARRPLHPFNGDKMHELTAGSWLGDASELMQVTGWRARWDVPRGLRETVAWYRENGWL